MTTTVSITAPVPPITRAITVADFTAYLTRKGWKPAVFRDPVSGAYFTPPKEITAPLLPVHERMLPTSLAYLADAEKRTAGEVLLEIADGAHPLDPAWQAASFVPETLRGPLHAALAEAEKMRVLLGFAHLPWCVEAKVPLTMAKCACAAAAKLGPKAIEELEDTVLDLRAELAVARGEALPPPAHLAVEHWRWMHADWKNQALTWIGGQAEQLHALVAQLRAGPFTDDEQRTEICTKAVRLETLAGALQGLVDHARRFG